MRIGLLGPVVAVLLGACASTVPETIRIAAPGNVQLAEVRGQPARYTGAEIRWGGSIVSTRNERDHTILEIVARDLDSDGRPLAEDKSLGRFLVKVRGFLDPAVYKSEREVTVRGRIETVIEQAIGEYRYTYPMIQADDVYLWKPRLSTASHYPYYYDPFWYDPWYPWGWPYYRHWPYYPW